MAEEWGPWIEHDGAEPSLREGFIYQCNFRLPGIMPKEHAELDSRSWPGFYWRWKQVRVGLLRTEKRRVCDDPSYAPVVRYRVKRPLALRQLIDLVENLPADPVQESLPHEGMPK